MEAVIQFLLDLQRHNDRTWFEANKDRYHAVQQHFNGFVEQLIAGVSEFDSGISGLTVQQCTYRIYRDIRFSPDKSPYKTHMGAYLCPKGRKSGYAGYYFHLEPKGAGYLDGSLLACGLYRPDKTVVQSIREEIVDNGRAFDAAVKAADGFEWDDTPVLRRMPQGFAEDTPFGCYLKRRDYSLAAPIPEGMTRSDELMEFCLYSFKKVKDFNAILNKAVAYVHEA